MQITRQADYAVRTVLYLAGVENGGRAPTSKIAQLQRMLGKQAIEAEILKEAVEFARERKWIARSPLLGKDDQ